MRRVYPFILENKVERKFGWHFRPGKSADMEVARSYAGVSLLWGIHLHVLCLGEIFGETSDQMRSGKSHSTGDLPEMTPQGGVGRVPSEREGGQSESVLLTSPCSRLCPPHLCVLLFWRHQYSFQHLTSSQSASFVYTFYVQLWQEVVFPIQLACFALDVVILDLNEPFLKQQHPTRERDTQRQRDDGGLWGPSTCPWRYLTVVSLWTPAASCMKWVDNF